VRKDGCFGSRNDGVVCEFAILGTSADKVDGMSVLLSVNPVPQAG
jgi:hypothetical protein